MYALTLPEMEIEKNYSYVPETTYSAIGMFETGNETLAALEPYIEYSYQIAAQAD
jgi:hypothetical protein